MPNYQNGKVYKITCPHGKCYIGSTTQLLCSRMSSHRYDVKCGRKKCAYDVFSCCGQAVITLIEKYPCNDKEELLTRERFHIQSTPCVNKTVPLRTREEYRVDTKVQKQKLDKAYRESHKSEIKAYMKAYQLHNKDAIRLQKKLKYQQHKSEVAQKGKLYRERNKGVIQERKRLAYLKAKQNTYVCKCGKTVPFIRKRVHESTKHHKQSM